MSKTEDHIEPEHQQEGVVWDLPLRVFHWLLMASVIGSIVSAKIENMFLHEKFGLTVAGLVMFRIVWGIAGSHHARFSRFMVPPSAVISYIRARIAGARDHRPGHAPTGAYATVVILLVLAAMAGLGMMSNDDVLYEGPLAAYVGDFTNMASTLHHRAEVVVFALIILHLAAILIYRVVFGIRLVPAMISGGTDPQARPVSRRHQIAGLVLMAALIGAMHLLSFLGNRFY
ncbi:cytochrome b/b6 domain-containing protein [Alphaproteobacteria bacterium LSUCC0684]